MQRIRHSLHAIHWRLFTALLVMGLCPTIYTTVRTFFLGQLPGEWSYSIAGQLSWVNLLYEIVNEAIILPLFFFIGEVISDRKAFINRLKTGLLIACGLYLVFSAGILLFAEPMLLRMAAAPEYLTEAATYIRIESVAHIFGILFRFALVALVTLGKDSLVYLLTGGQLLLCLLFDTFLVSTLPCSLCLGVNGIGISNAVTNLLLFGITLAILEREGYGICNGEALSFAWTRKLAKVGGLSGLESLVRNTAYLLMVSRMVNVVGEQGTYWVANNFIWGWLLLPILQLGELIKQETAREVEAIERNTLGYFTITGVVCLLWILLIPVYPPFMRYVLGFSEVDKLFHLVMVLLPFYMLYAFQNVFDSTFYGRGQTNYMLLESVVTNTLYYGTLFVCYRHNLWTPTLMGIALMFGIGNAFDSVVSALVYRHFRRKNRNASFVTPSSCHLPQRGRQE